MIDFSHFNNIVALLNFFTTEEKCLKVLKEERWKNGDVVCPHCGKHHCYTLKTGRYRCPECGLTFSVLVGTIFENTKVSLIKWFAAMYLMSTHRKGISSRQLAKDIAVTQKTAWFMMHKIRTLLAQYDSPSLNGIVQCDEVYIGGRETNKHEYKKGKGTQGGAGKMPVFGMVEEMGRLVAISVPNTTSETILPIIGQFIEEGSTIYTDESSIYNNLGNMGYEHHCVKHSAKEFSKDGITTNSIEGFWGELKRSIFGIHHFVSEGYLQSYIDESVFRYNTRKENTSAILHRLFRSAACGYVRYWDIAEWVKAA